MKILTLLLLGVCLTCIPGTTGRRPRCRDDKSNCVSWAGNGYCATNREVARWCKKACGTCGDKRKPCQDYRRECGQWAGRKFCTTNKAYMEIWCKKSCGMCGKGPPKVTKVQPGSRMIACVDRNKDCKYWASTGECSRNSAYMDDQCQKSCRICGQSTTSNTKRDYTCTFETGDGVGGTEVRIGAQTGQDCVDDCVEKKFAGDSTINGVTTYSTNREGCWCERSMSKVNRKSRTYKTCIIKFARTGSKKKTVAVKPTTNPQPKATGSDCGDGCGDKHVNCPTWKDQGYCSNSRMKAYMKQYCKCSCGLCGGTGSKKKTVAVKATTKPQPKATGADCGDGCGDKNANCPTWKKQKYCSDSSMKAYMKQYCKCSCGLCGESSNCGKQYEFQDPFAMIGRVVGGNTSRYGKWPWQIGIVKGNGGGVPRLDQQSFCGGTLVSKRTVLTAAHCFPDITINPSVHFVRVGNTNLRREEDQEEMVGVEKIIVHEGFNLQLRTYKDDIAIIILKKDVKLERAVQAACLPKKEETLPRCFVTGWGRLKERGLQSDTLQEAQLPIVNNVKCDAAMRKALQQTTRKIFDGMMCAGYEDGSVDACQGDSGGPLVCEKGDRWLLKGVVSWGVGCARKQNYGVYTNTFKYLDWIKTNGRW